MFQLLKPDITDFTAVAAHGGLMNLPTRQRKRYAQGPHEFEVETMDEEVLTPFDLQQETGLDLSGEQAKYEQGSPRKNAAMIWGNMETGDKEPYNFDFDIFFQSGDWIDMIKSEIGGGGDTQVASAPHPDEAWQGLWEKYLDIVPPGINTLDQFKNWFQNQDFDEEMSQVDTGIMQAAKGGRIKKAPGGIMNLGGLEKDYRTTGGFVPIGAYEKKDDVPARLSKNEFVMTADAVRAAGGGSINRGAQRMYDTMKHLEASPTAKRMTV